MVERINKLIQETQREPFAGIGKPEALTHAVSGFWSRRITDEHRMMYRVEGDALQIAQMRFHYLIRSIFQRNCETANTGLPRNALCISGSK